MLEVPENISREDLLKAIAEIDQLGIPPRAHSSTYDVVHDGKRYPPKLVVSIANRFANGNDLDRASFGGGIQTEAFQLLEHQGFIVDTKSDRFEQAYQTLREKFIRFFPDFSRFSGDDAYLAEERNYKDDLIEIYRRDVVPLLASSDWASAGPALLKLFTSQLPSIGVAQNLVGWRYVEPIKKMSPEQLESFAQKVAKLTDESAALSVRVDSFLDFFEQLPKENQLSPAASRSLVSFYLTLNNPGKYLFLKTREIGRVIKKFDPGFSWDPIRVQAEEILLINELAGRIFDRLTEEGWAPKDLIDVQSFLWTAETTDIAENGDSGSNDGEEIPLVQSWVFRIDTSQTSDAEEQNFKFDLGSHEGLKNFYLECTKSVKAGDIAIFLETGKQGLVFSEAGIKAAKLEESVLELSVDLFEIKNIAVQSQTNHQLIVPGLHTFARHSHGAANLVKEYFDKERHCFLLDWDTVSEGAGGTSSAVETAVLDVGGRAKWHYGANSVRAGSPVYLMRQGSEYEQAIIAKARVLSLPQVAQNDAGGPEDQDSHFVIVEIEAIRESVAGGAIRRPELMKKFPDQDWIAPASGAQILENHKSELHELWNQPSAAGVVGKLINEDEKMEPIKNQILYGPPGTGKTYHTVNKALEILDPEFYQVNKANRSVLKNRFDELKAKGRIGFVTFHQSFSYEDFVEGLRASTDEEGQVRYEVEDGVFKRMCDAAAAKVESDSHQSVDITGKRIWKMSLGNTLGSEAYVFDDCIKNDQILLGYGGDIDFGGALDRSAVAQRVIESGQEVRKYDYGVDAVNTFIHKIKNGDLVIVTDGNHKFRAIGEVTGDYRYRNDDDRDHFCQSRPVKWHRTYSPSLPYDQLMNNAFSQMTIYELRSGSIDLAKLKNLLDTNSLDPMSTRRRYKVGEVIQGEAEYVVDGISSEVLRIRKPNGNVIPLVWDILDELADLIQSGKISAEDIGKPSVFDGVDTQLEHSIVNSYCDVLPAILTKLSPGAVKIEQAVSKRPDAWVLIIDEINRGNIANILGELITLIEPSKRAGAEEALEVSLPYSKAKFSVPANLHIIGTMNTADRSLVHIDTALRRRFQFEAMMPDIKVLGELGITRVESVDIQKMLATINSRIELLYDREHTLGHSFFVPLRASPTLATLRGIFKNQIMPLLEEYFFEDWSRIQQVLGDNLKNGNDLQFYLPAYGAAEIDTLLGGENSQSMHEKTFKRNESALLNAEAYRGIYEQSAIED